MMIGDSQLRINRFVVLPVAVLIVVAATAYTSGVALPNGHKFDRLIGQNARLMLEECRRIFRV